MTKFFMFPVFLILAGAMVAGESGARVPVLLELFTSEGCSSCPPADRLLEKLDREQPVSGAELIVLSEHVDYWNQLGWKDPFSSSFFSARQREYADRLRGDVYTPELVVDGARGMVGSEAREVSDAIRDAAKHPKASMRVNAERADGKLKISLHMDNAPEGILFLALAHDAMKSQVLRGENAGRGLSHVAVVYSLEKVAKVGSGKPGDVERTIDIKGNEPVRVVAFIAGSANGRVLAVGQSKL